MFLEQEIWKEIKILKLDEYNFVTLKLENSERWELEIRIQH